MASFVGNLKNPFWSPTKMLIYEVKLLKHKEAHIFSTEQRKIQLKRITEKRSKFPMRSYKSRKIENYFHSFTA